MRVIVLGAGGFIGSHVAKRFAVLGHDVLALDSLSPVLYPADIKKNRLSALADAHGIETRIVDGLGLDWSQTTLGFDTLINLAAIPGLQPSWSHFDDYLRSNTLLLERIMRGLKANKDVRLIHASTSSVYGRYALQDEHGITDPASPYGLTKLAAENIVKSYSNRDSTKATILRLFSVYGPGQRPDMAYSRFIRQLKSGETVTIYGDGSQSRTNTYINDVVEAFLAATLSEYAEGIYNIGGGESVTLLESIDIISNLLGVTPKIRFVEPRAGDQIETRCNYLKAREILNWTPSTGFVAGITKQVESQ